MSRTLTISDELYERLEVEARVLGLGSVEGLLEQRVNNGANLQQRAEAVSSIDALRNRLLVKYGEMLDSTALIREDRAR
jgi:hypothetical protein